MSDSTQSTSMSLGPLTTEAKLITSGHHPDVAVDAPWAPVEGTKLYTNVFVWDETESKILLGFKKRGLGVNMYNGFGGKLEAGETPIVAASRELKEEAGITADLEPAGTLLFTTGSSPILAHIEIFRANSWSGAITESEEMRPEWFRLLPDATGPSSQLPPVPFDKMWKDDYLWWPMLLKKQRFIGRVDFGLPTDPEDWNSANLLKWWFGALE